MNKYKRFILICLIIGLMLMTPISAKIITSKVDAKEFDGTYNYVHIMHTVDFGDIRVFPEAYNQVMIGDNITFSSDCDGFGYYTVYRCNGELIERNT